MAQALMMVLAPVQGEQEAMEVTHQEAALATEVTHQEAALVTEVTHQELALVMELVQVLDLVLVQELELE